MNISSLNKSLKELTDRVQAIENYLNESESCFTDDTEGSDMEEDSDEDIPLRKRATTNVKDIFARKEEQPKLGGN